MADNVVQLNREKKPDILQFGKTAEYICDEVRRRASGRAEIARIWKEIDRQVDMIPMTRRDAQGRSLPSTDWMPELELGWQADTLETTVADIRRLMFPLDRDWFSAHSAVTKEYYDRVKAKSFLVNQAGDTTSRSVQDDTDAVVEAALQHYHSLYKSRDQWDLVNAESLKYGVGVGRARRVSLKKFEGDFRGKQAKGKRVPSFQARSIKNVYLDDREHAMLGEGLMVSPMMIEDSWFKLEDLKLAAVKGSNDPEREDGGWMPAEIMNVEPLDKKRGMVQVYEAEGDIVVPQEGAGSMLLENCLVTVVYGKGGPKVIRFRWREFPWSSYVVSPFHRHKIMSAYGDGPLKIGAPMYKAGVEALNRTMQAAALNAAPPIKWDPNDWRLAARGGPTVEPNALWDATTNVEAVKIGDPTALANVYSALRGEYRESTGTNSPRLGGQTKSHQAAFSVGSELERGLLRTVDYSNTVLDGPASQWLNMEYAMVKQTLQNDLVYVPKFREYVKISGSDLPDAVSFDVHGARGPMEEREKIAKRAGALQLAIQIEVQKVQLAQATGVPSKPLDLNAIQIYLLKEGGFVDVQSFFAAGNQPSPDGATEQPGIGGGIGLVSSNPNDIPA